MMLPSVWRPFDGSFIHEDSRYDLGDHFSAERIILFSML